MIVKRSELLEELNAVTAGLASKEIIEQSSCFVFNKGTVFTFNDETACIGPTSLKIHKGAIQAPLLLSILRKLPDKTLKVEESEAKIKIKGKRKLVTMLISRNIVLPVDDVETPEEWQAIPESFFDATELCEKCVGTNEGNFITTCIHLHPKWIEAFDNHQALRYKINTGLTGSSLVRWSSLKGTTFLDMTAWAVGKGWVHFKSSKKVQVSCRTYEEEFPDLQSVFASSDKYKPVKLPKNLKDGIELASLFAAENPSESLIEIQIEGKRISIKGIGITGSYSEHKTLDTACPTMHFLIRPELLSTILDTWETCSLSQERLMVSTPKYRYVTALQTPDKEE